MTAFTTPALGTDPDDLIVSGSVTSATTIFSTSATGFKSIIFQITSGGSGNTATLEQSNDGTTWQSIPISQTTSNGSWQSTTASATSGFFIAPVYAAFVRLRCTTYGSGTYTVVASLRSSLFMSPAVSQGGAAANSNAWPVKLAPSTNSGQLSHQRVTSAASTNATNVKNSQGSVFGWSLSNTAASACYFKFYNKASSPTVGTDTPVLTIVLPAGSTTSFQTPVGLAMTQTGISYAITGAASDSDTTAVSAGAVTGAIWYL